MWRWQFVSLNKQKTFGMWFGRWRGCSDEPGVIKWTSDFQTNYGVYIGATEFGKKYFYIRKQNVNL